jgi:hypothetical protein
MTMMIAKVNGITRQQLGNLHGDKSKVLTSGMHIFKCRGKGYEKAYQRIYTSVLV